MKGIVVGSREHRAIHEKGCPACGAPPGEWCRDRRCVGPVFNHVQPHKQRVRLIP